MEVTRPKQLGLLVWLVTLFHPKILKGQQHVAYWLLMVLAFIIGMWTGGR
jgi:hypothetical protein